MGNKPKEKNVKSKKRRLNAKGRNVARKSIAGILLASSLIVAAIPEDKSGSADAAGSPETMSYISDSGNLRNGDLTMPSSANLSNLDFLDPDKTDTDGNTFKSKEYNSYEIRELDGGLLALIWKYKYYMPQDGIAGTTNVGVLSGYNDTYKRENLKLDSQIITCYDFVSNTDYNSYVNTKMYDSLGTPLACSLNELRFVLDKNPVEDSIEVNQLGVPTKLTDVERYFPNEFDAWKTNYYDKLKKYKDANEGNEPSSLADMGMNKFEITGASMDAELKKVYFCDHTSRPGYTLTSVKNLARKSTYLSANKTTEIIPDEDSIYICQVYDNTAVIANNVDELNFKFLEGVVINAIAKNAFATSNNVTKMTVGRDVAFIGDGAFENSFIETVNFESVNYIGNRVFKSCQYLSDVKLADKTSIIGKEAFYDCKVLESISIPAGVQQIGFGAFAECDVLTTVDMTGNHGVNIGEYAFYSCPKLEIVRFPESYSVAIGKAAFALEPGTGSSSAMTDFEFPKDIKEYVSAANGEKYDDYTRISGDSYDSRIGDYILANRDNLKNVTMPENFGSSDIEVIPNNTFRLCKNLECLKFGDSVNTFVQFDDDLFKDVQNPKMYVYGPATCTRKGTQDGYADDKYYAYPRRSTWSCKTSVESTPGNFKAVPYVYYLDGKDHYEVGIDNEYRYELEVDDATGTAKILRCEFIKAPEDIDLVVPGQVADYQIKDMEQGCFDPLKSNILSVKVEDDSITNIGDEVFSECPKLHSVELGNSVESIGNKSFSDNPLLTEVLIGNSISTIGGEAFARCPKLEDVTFDSPIAYSKFSSIGANAFKTDSDKLYFHGDIVDGYLPFEYAMGNNKINDATSRRIAYKSLEPSSLTCIMDDKNGLVTLIDYPHYCDLPAEVQQAYKDNNMSDYQRNMVNSTLYLSIPEPVESIDVASYLDRDANNPNNNNFVYIDDANGTFEIGVTRRNAYGNPNLTDSNGELYSKVYESQGGYTPGLFSAVMGEDAEIAIYDGGIMRDSYTLKGNDWILSIDMPGVKYIPDYAFDSCERLESVIVGDNCSDIGTSAFQNCDKLSNIGTNNNPKYDFENYILYENKSDGTNEINTCLPSRGENRSSSQIWVNSDNDPKLANTSSINAGAFSSCKYITKADLTDTTVKAIPTLCFDGCEALTSVDLPETVTSIAKRAFDDGANSLDITIPVNSQISDEAFDKDATVTIWTYPECNITASYDPVGYDRIYIKYLDSEYSITFLNDDLTVYDRISVDSGKNGFYPENNPVPKLAEHNGYTFSHWYFDHPDGIKNVNESRQAIAIFKAPQTPSGNTPGGNTPGGNTPGGNTPGGNNNGNNNGGNKSPSSNSASKNETTYNVIVENGAGSGKYAAGKVVTITAYAPNTGLVFDKWTTSNSDIGFSNQTAVSTTFIMPTHDVKVTATYKSASNNSASTNTPSNNSSRPSNNGNNGNGSNGNSSPSGNSPSSGGGNKNNGGNTDVKITTDVIDNNKKNLASANVAGSTDNFVVKITDSASASAQVEAALRSKFGDGFDKVKYVAFDISLYDSTGTYLIENYDSLAVTITMPIPDELVPYAGNNKAAVVVNGAIDEKAVKFTTIDGVPCMTFVATHFSPYTVYVDTANLSGGEMDNTPKTGDGIAPKWFLSLGLLGAAGVLFFWKEKKKIPKTV